MIERLNDTHLEGVAELERLCFSAPWSKESLTLLLRDENYGMVAIEKNAVVSYAGLICALDEGEITNVATHPNHRNRGYAKQVLLELIATARAAGLVRITLEVRVSNLAARSLYASLGFRDCGLRKNFYAAPREDGIVMELLLNE